MSPELPRQSISVSLLGCHRHQFNTINATSSLLLLCCVQGWDAGTNVYPTAAIGDPLALSVAMLRKYATAATQYTVHANADVSGGSITQAWTWDVAQLSILCDAEPTCAGFNSQGYLKNTTSGLHPTAGITFYAKP